MAQKTSIPSDYAQTLAEIKKRVRAAQYEVLKSVNKALIALYWGIGRIIAERQKEKSWGKAWHGLAARISRYERFFSPKHLVYVEVLSVLSGKSKTAANGCRDWMDA